MQLLLCFALPFGVKRVLPPHRPCPRAARVLVSSTRTFARARRANPREQAWGTALTGAWVLKTCGTPATRGRRHFGDPFVSSVLGRVCALTVGVALMMVVLAPVDLAEVCVSSSDHTDDTRKDTPSAVHSPLAPARQCSSPTPPPVERCSSALILAPIPSLN